MRFSRSEHLELQPGCAGGLGHRAHPPVVQEAAAIEDDPVMPLAARRSAITLPICFAPFTLPPRAPSAKAAFVAGSALEADATVRPVVSSTAWT